MEILSSISLQILNKAIDKASVEHKLIANNIANVDSDGYRTLTVQFGSVYQDILRAIADGDMEELQRVGPSWNPTSDVGFHPTDGVVKLDREMVKLAKNTLQFQSLAVAKSQLSEILKLAINGRNS